MKLRCPECGTVNQIPAAPKQKHRYACRNCRARLPQHAISEVRTPRPTSFSSLRGPTKCATVTLILVILLTGVEMFYIIGLMRLVAGDTPLEDPTWALVGFELLEAGSALATIILIRDISSRQEEKHRLLGLGTITPPS